MQYHLRPLDVQNYGVVHHSVRSGSNIVGAVAVPNPSGVLQAAVLVEEPADYDAPFEILVVAMVSAYSEVPHDVLGHCVGTVSMNDPRGGVQQAAVYAYRLPAATA